MTATSAPRSGRLKNPNQDFISFEKVTKTYPTRTGLNVVIIHPDFVGKKLPTSREEKVKVYYQESDGRDAVELTRAITNP